MNLKIGLITGLLCLPSIHPVSAETMISTTNNGLRCTDEKALASLTAPDGSVKDVARVPNTTAFQTFEKYCKRVPAGDAVNVVSRRKNTSIVTADGRTWFIPNIDYMTPGPTCMHSGERQTLTGQMVEGIQRTDESDPSKVMRYARLQLDSPVCFIGNVAEPQGRYVSITTTSESGAEIIQSLKGAHVQITGTLDTPATSNEPPDNMTMMDPQIRRTK
jgi:hypothetical protein